MKKYLFLFVAIFLFLTSCEDKVKPGVYEGSDISVNASIVRNKVTKSPVLTINSAGDWTLYAGYSDDAINFKKAFIGDSKGVFPIDVFGIADSVRVYYQLVTDEGKAILSERHLPMEGGYNFRDLGGIKNKDNRYVKWGRFFRTDELGKLTDFDLSYLSSIPVTSVVDFRTKHEIEINPDRYPSGVKNKIELNISPGNLSIEDLSSGKLSKMNFDSVMVSMNRAFVTDSVIIGQYKEFFRILQDESNLPVIFHCSAGKDRTGMGAALILFALGVDEDTVMKDYLLSNVYLGNKYAGLIEQHPYLEPMFVVKPEYMQASIDAMKEKYGSVENFLTGRLNVDLTKFREMYLY